MKKVDIGIYHKDPEAYREIIEEVYTKYPEGVTLPSEYAQYIQEDCLRLLIRLARYKFVARLIKKTDSLLEVGCGSGLGAIFLSQHCSRVKGIDIKETEIEEAKSINKRENVSFEKVNLFELKNKEPLHDVVIALDVIEHFNEKDGEDMLFAMASLLKPNGMLILGTPSLYSLPYQSEISRASHIKCYDQKELENLMEKCFHRTLSFSMNDELVHTGFSKMAWYYFCLGFNKKNNNRVQL